MYFWIVDIGRNKVVSDFLKLVVGRCYDLGILWMGWIIL